MEIVYAKEDFPTAFSKALFLAGPTPRRQNVPSWRPEALALFEKYGYDGTVFIPEPRDGSFRGSYDDQVAWEAEGLRMADRILFWVPRNLKTLPGFTTNVEFGLWAHSGKVVLGAPNDAPKTRYLRHVAETQNIPQLETLESAVVQTLTHIGEGALRTGGERYVPFHIWKTQSFQDWYRAQRAAGNRLDGAKVEWTFRVGPRKESVFFWALHVDVYVEGEDRHKTNEVVLSRPDVATVVLYQRGKTLRETMVVLIREFRSPVSNASGYVWELPGGSSPNPLFPSVLAAHEVEEETGLRIDAARLKAHGARQVAATLSAHKAHIFSAEITAQELHWLKAQSGISHGVVQDTERTYVEICTLEELLARDVVDWSMLGMMFSVIADSVPAYEKSID